MGYYVPPERQDLIIFDKWHEAIKWVDYLFAHDKLNEIDYELLTKQLRHSYFGSREEQEAIRIATFLIEVFPDEWAQFHPST